MNIIIFDYNNQCHQWEGSKGFSNDFIFKKEFFEEPSAAQKYIEETIEGIKSNAFRENYKCADISNPVETSKINFKPSTNYGITVIDFPGKRIYSMQEYSSIGNIHYMEIDLLLSPSYSIYGVDKSNILRNYLYLLEKEIFFCSDEFNKETAQKLKGYLNAVDNPNELAEFQKMQINGNKLKLHNDFTLNKKTGWKFQEHQSYHDYKINLAIVKTLAKKGIVLQSHQVQDWAKFYEELIHDMNIDDGTNKRANTDFLTKPYIELEKRRLNKTIKKVAKKTNKPAKI